MHGTFTIIINQKRGGCYFTPHPRSACGTYWDLCLVRRLCTHNEQVTTFNKPRPFPYVNKLDHIPSSYVYSGSFTMKLLGFHDFSLDQSEELGIPEWTATYVSTEVKYASTHCFLTNDFIYLL